MMTLIMMQTALARIKYYHCSCDTCKLQNIAIRYTLRKIKLVISQSKAKTQSIKQLVALTSLWYYFYFQSPILKISLCRQTNTRALIGVYTSFIASDQTSIRNITYSASIQVRPVQCNIYKSLIMVTNVPFTKILKQDKHMLECSAEFTLTRQQFMYFK